MAKAVYTTVRLDAAGRHDAERLLNQLRRDMGVKTSRDLIVRALLWGVSAPQAAGILSAYIKHAETASEGEHWGVGRLSNVGADGLPQKFEYGLYGSRTRRLRRPQGSTEAVPP
jgi:hypothetical protein